MPDIKLTYFNLRGRGEGVRVLLYYAGKNFEDKRIPPAWEDMEGWKEMKPTTPWGTLPVLEYDGKVIGQSLSMARFLANELGLAGKTNLEKAQADEIVDAINDLVIKQAQLYFAKDEEGMKKHLGETIPTILGSMEKTLTSRGGYYLVGGSATWADIFLFTFIDGLGEEVKLEGLPNISTLVDKIRNQPNVKAYLATRPVSVI